MSGKGFIPAAELCVGDEVCCASAAGAAKSQGTGIIEKILPEVAGEPMKVYNFQVEDLHTYHVGLIGVWVHNADYGKKVTIWKGKDKYVPDLANEIEQKYPGRVQAVEKVIRGIDGKIITDLDIELDNIVIQVKSGSAKGLTAQMIRTANATGKKVISFTPDISQSSAVLRGVRQIDFETFTTIKELLEYLSNH